MQQIKVIPLGISAGTPTLERNLAATAVVADDRALLFDCGEGTQHQLMRAAFNATHIEAIFISHLHGDHLYGLPGLLATFSMLDRTAPLLVAGPKGIAEFVRSAMTASRLWLDYPLELAELSPDFVHARGGLTVSCALLQHRVESYGFLVREAERRGRFDAAKALSLGVPEGLLFGQLQRGEAVEIGGRIVECSEVSGPERSGRRIAVCGDSRPCQAAVKLAEGADLLVHEATYGDDMAEEAKERGHSTAREAAAVARDAAVGRLLLTHFSPRYPDAGELASQARELFPESDAAAELAIYAVAARE